MFPHFGQEDFAGCSGLRETGGRPLDPGQAPVLSWSARTWVKEESFERGVARQGHCWRPSGWKREAERARRCTQPSAGAEGNQEYSFHARKTRSVQNRPVTHGGLDTHLQRIRHISRPRRSATLVSTLRLTVMPTRAALPADQLCKRDRPTFAEERRTLGKNAHQSVHLISNRSVAHHLPAT